MGNFRKKIRWQARVESSLAALLDLDVGYPVVINLLFYVW